MIRRLAHSVPVTALLVFFTFISTPRQVFSAVETSNSYSFKTLDIAEEYVFSEPINGESLIASVEVIEQYVPTVVPQVDVTTFVAPSPTLTVQPTVTPIPTQMPTVTPTLIVVEETKEVQITAPHEIQALIDRYAAEYGADPAKMAIIAKCESGFNSSAVSPSGAYVGLFQFVAGTWISNRNAMGLDSNPALRANAEEAIKTAAFKMGRDGYGAWPVCGSIK